MGFLRRVLTTDKTEKRATLETLLGLQLWPSAKSGVAVSEDTALNYSAVWACVRIISESIASLPLHLMRRQGRNRYQATDHSLYSVLHTLSNSEMTAMDFRLMMFSQVLLWGTAFAEKEYDKRGRIVALWPLLSRHMETSEMRNGMRWWGYRLPDGNLRWYNQDYLHIVRGLGGDGVWGYSPVRMAAREAVGLGLATEEFGARFFSNGSHLGGILEHPGRLSPEAHARLRASINEQHGGLSKAHKLKILEEGMSYKSIGVPPEEAQFLETRKFQVTEIARIFRVPPHMLADLERATFSNIEHQGQEFVTYTLTPWLVGHEQAITRDLLDEGERQTYFAKYNVAGLLRGDTLSRYQAYNTGINSGFMTRNEAREYEDWNPIDGLDEPLVPLNMVEVGQELLPPAEGRALPMSVETRAMEIRLDRQRTINRYVRLFEDATARLVRRETADIRRAIPRHLGKRSVDDFEKWLAEFYRDLREAIPGYYDALMRTLAEQIFEAVAEELQTDAPELTPELDEWIRGYLENFAAVYAVGGEKQIRALLAEAEDEEAAAQAVLERMDGWDENRASKTGLDQAFEAGNALALYAYRKKNVRVIVWRGGDCPLCRKWNGRKIGIDETFATEGDVVDAGDGETAPLPIQRTIRHGPLHGGCDCTIQAV